TAARLLCRLEPRPCLLGLGAPRVLGRFQPRSRLLCLRGPRALGLPQPLLAALGGLRERDAPPLLARLQLAAQFRERLLAFLKLASELLGTTFEIVRALGGLLLVRLRRAVHAAQLVKLALGGEGAVHGL